MDISIYGETTEYCMRPFMNITKALADEHRVRMLLALRRGELCVCRITELLGLAPSTISKHLSILYQAGLVEYRKSGRWIYFRLPGREATPVVKRTLAWVVGSVEEEPRIQEDAAELETILKRTEQAQSQPACKG